MVDRTKQAPYRTSPSLRHTRLGHKPLQVPRIQIGTNTTSANTTRRAQTQKNRRSWGKRHSLGQRATPPTSKPKRTWQPFKSRVSKTRPPAKPHAAPSDGVLRLSKRMFIYGVLVFPLIAALMMFMIKQATFPVWASASPEMIKRGRIIASDGTFLAEGDWTYRRYPQMKLGANLTGFTSNKNFYYPTPEDEIADNRHYGLEGIEAQLDEPLQEGKDVHLTIDLQLQAIAQAALRQATGNYAAQSGGVVMLEVGTNRILAAASYPEFDPNQYRDFDPWFYRNRPFLDQMDPGSIFKPIVVASLLEDERLGLDETHFVPKTLKVGNHTFQESLAHPTSLATGDLLKYSSNVGMINITNRYSPTELYWALRDFGFGEKVPLPHVSTRSGSLRPWEEWVPQDQASISIGQGITATALQLALAYSVIANEGRYLPPRLVERIGKDVVDTPQQAARQVVKPEVANAVRDMLIAAANHGGARNALVPGVVIAGKTGTADAFNLSQQRYVKGEYTTSFAGFFPAHDPKAVIVAYVNLPQGEKVYGSTVAAPIFKDIVGEALSYWGIPPDHTDLFAWQ